MAALPPLQYHITRMGPDPEREKLNRILEDARKRFSTLDGDITFLKAQIVALTGVNGVVTSVNGQQGDVTISLASLGGVPITRNISSGQGLAGGGNLSADRTLSVKISTDPGNTISFGTDDGVFATGGGGSALPYITGLAQDCDVGDTVTFTPTLTLHGGGSSNRWGVVTGAPPDGVTVDPSDGSHTGATTNAGIFDWLLGATPLDGSFTGHTAVSHQRITVFQQGLMPTDIASCTGWIDATDPATLFTDTGATTPVTTDGQTVLRVLDKQSSDIWENNNTPVYSTGVLNGKSVLSFDQGDYLRQQSGRTTSNLITASSHTIIIVARWQDVTNSDIGYGAAAKLADSASWMGVHLADAASRVALYNYSGGAQYAEVNQSQSTWVIISVQHGGGDIRARVNRGSWTTVSSGNTGNLSSELYVGAIGSSGWSSRIQQFATFNSQIGDSDLEGVEDYFAWVSGISLP